jgi:hypothetical protein
MKNCSYCGKEYPDDVSFCAIDQNPLQPSDPALVTEEFSGKKLIAICNAVSRINEQTSEFTFGVDRAVKVAFRGQDIYLIVGDVGTVALPSVRGLRGCWSKCKSVYALAQSHEQIDWMARNADVFESARNDSTFPIFWVKQSLLRKIPELD